MAESGDPPADYTDRLGGYPHMIAKHRDLAITPEQRLRFATLMSLAAAPVPRWGWGEAPPYVP